MSDFKFLDNLTSAFALLPGVGEKTATRYAYSVVEKMSDEDVDNFVKALKEVKTNIKHCSTCGMLTLTDPCTICSSSRDKSKIMVLKDTRDVLAIEKMGEYQGLYHCLNGLISPMDGIGPEDINIDILEKRINDETKEIIIATSFTPSGETTAIYLEKILSRYNVTISRLGYGLPSGGDIEYVDELTLKRAIENRTKRN